MNAHGKSMPPQRSSSIRNPSDRFFFIRGLRERKTSEHFLLMTQRKSANPTQSKKPKTPPPRNRAPAARATDATDGSDKPVYRLRDLVKRYGVATLDEVLLYVGIEKAEFIATGRLISTSRVSKDTARIFGQAADFYDGATEDQLDALAGINPDLLRVAIWAAAENERLAELHAQSRTAGTQRRSTFEVAYAELRDKALGRREQTRELLLSLSGNDAVRRKTIDDAYGLSRSPRQLSDSLTALSRLGRRYLTDAAPELAQRRQRSRLREELLADLEALAVSVLEQGESAQAVANLPDVTQSDVDYWDGVALWFLRRIMDSFDAARATDPSVPRLTAIATRSALGLYRPRSAASPKTPKPKDRGGASPAPPAPPNPPASPASAAPSASSAPSEAPTSATPTP